MAPLITTKLLSSALITFFAVDRLMDHFIIIVPEGMSMMPAISRKGEALLGYRSARGIVKAKVGDIVALHSYVDPAMVVCKRVVGVEGDVIHNVKRETIYRQSTVIIPRNKDDTEVRDMIENDGVDVLVPKGCVWLEGDNKRFSLDSRYAGPIPVGMLMYKVTRIIYPFSEFGRSLAKPDGEEAIVKAG